MRFELAARMWRLTLGRWRLFFPSNIHQVLAATWGIRYTRYPSVRLRQVWLGPFKIDCRG